MNTEQMIAQYIKLRDKVDLLTKQFEESLAPYKMGMQALEGAVTIEMDKLGVDSIKCNGVGTAFRKTTTSAKVADREAFMDFVFDGRREGFLTTHVSKEAVEEWIEQNQSPPPGVDVAFIKKTQFRRA